MAKWECGGQQRMTLTSSSSSSSSSRRYVPEVRLCYLLETTNFGPHMLTTSATATKV